MRGLQEIKSLSKRASISVSNPQAGFSGTSGSIFSLLWWLLMKHFLPQNSRSCVKD